MFSWQTINGLCKCAQLEFQPLLKAIYSSLGVDNDADDS